MRIDVQQHGSVRVVVPPDALTESLVQEVQAVLSADGGQIGVRLVVDMSQVAYVDSAGIAFLLELAGQTAAGASRPRLAALNETVTEALYLTETRARFQVFDSVEDAVHSYV
ncbi:MAG: STAS domain-containing protein [Planctomycetes bacterium]|nr:STAS domain-containing protein [Planctomycetota bacterium]